MAKIVLAVKDFFSGASDTYKDKIFKHKLKILYRILLILALVMAGIVTVKLRMDNRVYTGSEVLSEMEIETSENGIYENYNGNILVYSKDGISAYDKKGTRLWNQPYQMQSPIVKTAGEYVVAGDYKGSTIYVMNTSGLVGENNTSMLIQDLSISPKGVVTALLEKDSSTMINIYSADGKNKIAGITTSMRDSGYPIAFSMSPDNTKLAVSYLKPKGGQVNSSIAFYNFGDVGQNVSNKLVSGFDFEKNIIPYVQYTNNNTAVAVADSALLIFHGKQIPAKDIEQPLEEEVQSIFCSDDFIALVFNNTVSKIKYSIDIYDMNGKKQGNILTDMEYDNILFNKNDIIIYNESKLQIFNKKGDSKYDGSLGENIGFLLPTENRNKFLIGQGNKLKHISLR